MNKMKTLFATPKKAAVTVICIIFVVILLGAGTAFATGRIAESSSIGKENAQNFAFADAGVDPLSAEAVRTEFDFEQGQFIYEVEFFADGTDYDYWIKASDGSVVKKEVDAENAGYKAQGNTNIGKNSANSGTNNTTAGENNVNSGTNNTTAEENPANTGNTEDFGAGTANGGSDSYIGIENAKSIAVTHAGCAISDVIFSKAKLDHEDGYMVYEIEFYKDRTEYEYTINALTGDIMEYDSDWDD